MKYMMRRRSAKKIQKGGKREDKWAVRQPNLPGEYSKAAYVIEEKTRVKMVLGLLR